MEATTVTHARLGAIGTGAIGTTGHAIEAFPGTVCTLASVPAKVPFTLLGASDAVALKATHDTDAVFGTASPLALLAALVSHAVSGAIDSDTFAPTLHATSAGVAVVSARGADFAVDVAIVSTRLGAIVSGAFEAAILPTAGLGAVGIGARCSTVFTAAEDRNRSPDGTV